MDYYSAAKKKKKKKKNNEILPFATLWSGARADYASGSQSRTSTRGFHSHVEFKKQSMNTGEWGEKREANPKTHKDGTNRVDGDGGGGGWAVG